MEQNNNYYFNIEEIVDFVSVNNGVTEREIMDNYDIDESGSLFQSSKTIREASNDDNQVMDNIKYDLIKLLLTTILSQGTTETIGAQWAINTLKENKMLEIK